MKVTNMFQLFYFLFVFFYVTTLAQRLLLRDIVVVVMSQQDPYDTSLAENLRDNIYKQAETLQMAPPPMHFAHTDFVHPGAWTLLPILPQLDSMYGKNSSYILFCQSSTSVDAVKLLKVLGKYAPKQERWYGHALRDQDTTIIHHFAFPKNPNAFKYPNLASGVIMTIDLIKKLSQRLQVGDYPKNPDFSIDAAHELALFIWQEGKGPELRHLDSMCARPGPHCVTKPHIFVPCEKPVKSKDIYFAVKTCSKFHKERLPVVKDTWGKYTSRINFFSDVEDSSVGSISLGIPNTERGHCGKTLAILSYVSSQHIVDPSIKWLVIADDDTILSVGRLRKLLSCYNASTKVALGERYGYNVALPRATGGYNYITGGGGIILSIPLVQVLAKGENCICPSNSTPDDMYLGICLANLGVPIIHSPHFHQARPSDYAKGYLESYRPISFHKHWMVDPKQVYRDWFEFDDASLSTLHEEL
ncbi:beta-1,3-glucosyltransferase [Thrips palmi]|uniref:Beta-1,3-glucosyltransferase n=1 Tax=Thrips palmi TaxID=161013 RepID=A0A6P8YVH4_THRPL|nr:beta-1,3-glucosyltransferase [Thrips palmi]